MKSLTNLCLMVFAATGMACGTAYAPAQGEEATPSALHTPQIDLATPTVAPTPLFNAEQVSYLENVVEPCVLIEGSSTDPCVRREWSYTYWVDYVHPDQTVRIEIERQGGQASSSVKPTVLEGMRSMFDDWAELGYGYSGYIPHIIVRGIFLPDSTRCTLPTRQISKGHGAARLLGSVDEGGGDIECYTDFNVREYVVGNGPEYHTLQPFSDIPYAHENFELYKTEDYQRGASEYVGRIWEGSEFVLALGLNLNKAVEVWSVLFAGDIQRRENGSRGRYGVNLSWDAYAAELRNAHATVAAEHEFALVDDANLKYLREHLQTYGYYEDFAEHISPPPPSFTD